MSGFMIEAPNVSIAWLKGIKHLLGCGGECFNLIVQIANPTELETPIHEAYEQLVASHGLLTIKQVTYTVFPHSLYIDPPVAKDASKLFDVYNRRNGIFDRLQQRYPGKMRWGSYFRRMTHYRGLDKGGHAVTTNQLQRIIKMLRERGRMYKAAYTISIGIPPVDGRRIMGGPCLNYMALQLDSPKVLNLLAVYRNHDFIQRTYGNYLALGYLMEFLCEQTGYTLGTLTCVSSHASIKNLSRSDSWPTNAELQQITGGLEYT